VPPDPDSQQADAGWTRLLPQPFLLLFAAATVTMLLAANPYEGVLVRNLVDPTIVAVTLALSCWAISFPFSRDHLVRSVAGVVISLPLLLSGYVFGWVRYAEVSLSLRVVAELTMLALLIAVLLFLTKHIRWSPDSARFLNLFAAFCVILTLPAIFRTVVQSDGSLRTDSVLPDTASLYRPDIYVIVLDGYTGQESLVANYDFDNGPWLDSLAARGFSIPKRPRSNYVKTFLSVGTMLNRGYYEELTPPAREPRDRNEYNNRMEYGRTILDLKELGYRFYYVGSSYPPLATNRLADAQYSERPSRDFEDLYYRMTALQPTFLLCVLWGDCRPYVPFGAESAEETGARIEYLMKLIERPGPKVVYAHWLLPHGPYRFDAACRGQPPRWEEDFAAVERDPLLRSLYVDQILCTNRKLLDVIERIRSAAAESVVILQSDHGHGRFLKWVPTSLEEASAEQVRERFDVFAAYSGPGGIGDSIAAFPTPVNVFRTLFRVLWDVDEPPLGDRHYWSEGDRSLALSEVTLD
jgi:hypothetical protein